MAQYVEEIRVPALVGPTEANAHDHYDIRVSSVISCTRYTHTHTRLMALFPNGPFSGTTQVSRYQKGKTNLDFTEARVSGSGISWAICKSAPRSRQITTPAPHHSVFYRPDVLPAAQPTVSKHRRLNHALGTKIQISSLNIPSG